MGNQLFFIAFRSFLFRTRFHLDAAGMAWLARVSFFQPSTRKPSPRSRDLAVTAAFLGPSLFFFLRRLLLLLSVGHGAQQDARHGARDTGPGAMLNGFPHTGALARTATNIKVGAVSPLAGIFKGVLGRPRLGWGRAAWHNHPTQTDLFSFKSSAPRRVWVFRKPGPPPPRGPGSCAKGVGNFYPSRHLRHWKNVTPFAGPKCPGFWVAPQLPVGGG